MFSFRENFSKNKCFLIIGILFLFSVGADGAQSKKNSLIPSDIQLCKKDDPNLNQCLVNLFEGLKPRLMKGWPQVGLPSLDPLLLLEIVVFKGGQARAPRAVLRNIRAEGTSNFKLNYIRAKPDELEIAVGVFFPFIKFEGTYDVNMKILSLQMKGKGPLKGNASEITADAVLKGKFIEKTGDQERYVEFVNATVDVKLKDYNIKVDKLFPDKQLNDALNVLMNDKKNQSFQTAKPIIDKVGARMVLELVNKIAKHFAFDDVFAE